MIPLRSRKDGKKIRGDLASLSLTEILQTLQLGTKTARLTLTTGTRTGRIWIEAGMITNASAAQLSGEDALFHLMSWRQGSFIIDPGCRSECRTINENTEYLLLEGMRRYDETEARSGEDRSADQVAWQSAVLAWSGRILACVSTLILSFVVVMPLWPDSVLQTVDAGPVAPPSAGQRHGALLRTSLLHELSHSLRARHVSPVEKPAVIEQAISPRIEPEAIVVEQRPMYSLPQQVLIPPSPAPATIEFVGRSRIKEGKLTLLINDEEVYSLSLSGAQGRTVGRFTGKGGQQFEESLTVPPGEHRIIARLDLNGKQKVYEETLDIALEPGAATRVTVTLGKVFGRRVKLEQQPSQGTATESAR